MSGPVCRSPVFVVRCAFHPVAVRTARHQVPIVPIAVPNEHGHLGLATLLPLIVAVEENQASTGVEQPFPHASHARSGLLGQGIQRF